MKVHMEENKSWQRVFDDISAEFFRINDFFSFFIEKFMVCVVTNGTIKALIGIKQEIFHMLYIFLDFFLNFNDFKG